MPAPIRPREAALRTAAVAGLCGLAIVQLVALPYALVQGPQIAAISGAAIAGALWVASALATAGEDGGRAAWRGTTALSALTGCGWLVTRAVAVPGVPEDAGHWTSPLGLAAAALAAVLVGLSVAALGRPRTLRPLAAAVGVSLALAPPAALLLVALGPPPAHQHGLAANSISPHRFHAATGASPADAARFRPGFGGHRGRYVYANAARPHLPPWALALALGAAAALVASAGGALRRRSLTLAAVCALTLALPVASASAHATLVRAAPAALARVASPPRQVTLTFSEPVQGEIALLDHAGRPVAAAAVGRDRRVAVLALRRPLAPDSYTVRYRVISADAHALAGALTFATGGAPLLPPAGASAAGPSETGAWAVDARFTELAALGLLLALAVFRVLVWGPALAAVPGVTARERAAARRRHWRAFWCVLALAGIAEAGVLVVKAALVYGSGVWGSLTTPAAAERLAASTRFGDLLGLRGGLLCAIAAVAFWQWARGPEADERPAPQLAIAGLSAVALGLVSAQGHASQAPLPALSVAFDAVHLGAAAIWIGGLACLAAVLRGAPPALAGAVLRRFSRVALGAVVVIGATGLARAVGELGGPAQLWATPYGRSLLAKTALLAPVALLARRNRGAVAAFARDGGQLTATAVRRVWRDVRAELAVGAGIVLVASILVAQVPGRV
jgi:copper transport protein